MDRCSDCACLPDESRRRGHNRTKPVVSAAAKSIYQIRVSLRRVPREKTVGTSKTNPLGRSRTNEETDRKRILHAPESKASSDALTAETKRTKQRTCQRMIGDL